MIEQHKLHIGYWLLVFFVLLPASAGVAEVKNPDTYIYVRIGDVDSLDPAYFYDAFSNEAIMNIYDNLFAFDRDSTQQMAPMIAERVPSRANGLISADGKTYTIPIRKGIHFHDGSLLTPEDVRYSILRFLLQDRAGGPSSILLEPLLGYSSTRDDHGKIRVTAYKDAAKAVQVQRNDVVLHLHAPFAPLLSIFCLWAPPVSKKWAIKNGDWDGGETTWAKYNNPKKQSSPFYEREAGTGPFELERWDHKTHQVVLARNNHYWRKPARLKHVVIKGIDEFATRKLMLEAGDADNIYVQPETFRQFQDISGIQVIDGLRSMELNPVIFFTFHVNPVGNPNIGSAKLDGKGIPPDFFSDPDVRKGFAYAFDYEGYLRDIYRGKSPQSTGCIPATLVGHNPNQKTYTLDLAKAAERLKKAWGGKAWDAGFTFTLTYSTGRKPWEIACQILKRNIESLNSKFHLNLRGVEWPTFLDYYIASRLPLFILDWQADYPDAHSFAFPMMHSRGDFPRAQGYKNLEADKLIEEAAREINSTRRKRLYAELQEIEYNDVPHIVIVEPAEFRVQRDWVKGWIFNPMLPDSSNSNYYYPMWKQ